MVNDAGAVANEAGTSAGIGNSTDKDLLAALRSHSEIVLTSGKTARADRYRMPKTADLAVLTRSGIDELQLEPKPGQRLIILGDQATSYLSALDQLKDLGYRNVHVEYGPTGFRQVRRDLDLTLISGVSEGGIATFAEAHSLTQLDHFELDDLVVWAC